jgi:hypothetical protein
LIAAMAEQRELGLDAQLDFGRSASRVPDARRSSDAVNGALLPAASNAYGGCRTNEAAMWQGRAVDEETDDEANGWDSFSLPSTRRATKVLSPTSTKYWSGSVMVASSTWFAVTC